MHLFLNARGVSSLILGMVLLGSSVTSFAAEEKLHYRWFWGGSVGGSSFDLAAAASTNEPDPDIAVIRFARVYEHFAFEGRVSAHTEVRSSGDSRVNHAFAIYAEPRIPIGEKAGIYALGGYGAIDFDTDGLEGIDGDSATYGAGVWFSPTDRFNIELEWLRMYDKAAIQIDALTLGFTYAYSPIIRVTR